MLNFPQQIGNVFYALDTTGWNAVNMGELADAVISWWTTSMKPQVNSSCSLVSVKVTDLSSPTAATVEKTPTTAQAGTNAGTALPNEVSVALHKAANYRGRSAKGRTYWPQVLQGHLADSNTLTSTAAAAMVSTYNALITAINGLSPDHPDFGYVSYYSNKTLRSTPLFIPVTAFVLRDNIVDSQRRRGPGRGR